MMVGLRSITVKGWYGNIYSIIWNFPSYRDTLKSTIGIDSMDNFSMDLCQSTISKCMVPRWWKVPINWILPLVHLNKHLSMVFSIKLCNGLLDLVGSSKGISNSLKMHYLDIVWLNHEFIKVLKISMSEINLRLS